MANHPLVDENGLAVITPGPSDYVRVVDRATGASRNARADGLPVSAQVNGRIVALEQSQAAGAVGFATKALMEADTSRPAGTLALVTNDPIPENNGMHRWTGASWIKAPDLVRTGDAVILGGADAVTVDTAAKTINFSTDARVFHSFGYLILDAPQSLDYSAIPFGTTHYLSIDRGTNIFRLVVGSGLGQLSAMEVVVARFLHYSDGRAELFGLPGGYTRNGVVVPGHGGRPGARLGTYIYSSQSPNIDTANKRIQFFSGGRVIRGDGGTFFVPAGSVSYAGVESQPQACLVVDHETLAYELLTTSQINVAPDTKIVIGYFVPPRLALEGMPYPWRRDGSFVDTASYELGVLFAEPEDIVLDPVTQSLSVAAGRAIFAKGGTVQVSGAVASYAGIEGDYMHLVLDRTSGSLRWVLPGSLWSLSTNDVAVARFNKHSLDLVGLPGGYTLNDRVIGGIHPATRVETVPVLGWDLSGEYTAPALPGYRASDPLPATDVLSTDIYGWFDGIASAYPGYVTKTHLGDEYTGRPIHEYRFRPDMGGSTDPVRVLVHGATHGEPMSYLVPYHAMQLIASEWEADPLLEALRWGVEFSVLPAVNPSGVDDSNNRYNSRGVNLNRNFPIGWIAGGDNPGTAPLSEIEAQLAYENMKSFKPHIFLDVHSFGTSEAGEFLWILPEAAEDARFAGAAMINRMARKWATEHPWMPPASALDRNIPTVTPGGSAVAANALGARGATFELGTRIIGEQPSAEPYSALSVRYAVEAFINYLIIMLRRVA